VVPPMVIDCTVWPDALVTLSTAVSLNFFSLVPLDCGADRLEAGVVGEHSVSCRQPLTCVLAGDERHGANRGSLVNTTVKDFWPAKASVEIASITPRTKDFFMRLIVSFFSSSDFTEGV